MSLESLWLPLLIGGTVVGTAAATGAFSGGKDGISMPSAAAASNMAKTAPPVAQLSEQEKMNKRLAASQLTKDWGIGVKLGKPGLLGVGTI